MKRNTIITSGVAVVAAAGLAFGGAALANADTKPSPTASPSPAATKTPGPPAAPGAPGAHGLEHARQAHAKKQARLLSGATAVKATQAATTKEPTAKLEHVASDLKGGYVARMIRPDGTRIVLHMDANFTVTSDEVAPQHAPGKHGKGRDQAPGQQGKQTPAPSGTPSTGS
jgi:hypothetical protein